MDPPPLPGGPRGLSGGIVRSGRECGIISHWKNRFERIGLARSYLRSNSEWRDFILFQRMADA